VAEWVVAVLVIITRYIADASLQVSGSNQSPRDTSGAFTELSTAAHRTAAAASNQFRMWNRSGANCVLPFRKAVIRTFPPQYRGI
jgi:uncharacterized MAPEG superfamily protein